MLFLRKRLLPAVCVLALSAAASQVLVAGAAEPSGTTFEMFDTMTLADGTEVGAKGGSGSAAERILGTPRSGLAWHSGAWVGGRFNTETINRFGKWRGRPVDVVTAYAENSSYAAMTRETWSIDTWKGFAGKLNYGLSPLPDDGAGSFESTAHQGCQTRSARQRPH
jgi:hypothetical protein